MPVIKTTTIEELPPSHVPRNEIAIKSDITPETAYLTHYPGSNDKPQLHITVLQGVSGHSIFLAEADAKAARDFLNKYFPD